MTRRRAMNEFRKTAFALCAALLAGCASIPAEAPVLSQQLGERMSALETAHLSLVRQFFDEKRKHIREFVEETWIPMFAESLFADPRVTAVWDEVVRSGNPKDRLRFLTILGPRLQWKIDAKREELLQPLDDLENVVTDRLRGEYDQMRGINNSLTAFLASAAQVDENRKRYLELIGIKESDIARVITDTDDAVHGLVDSTRDVSGQVDAALAFAAKIKSIIGNLKK